MEEIDFKVIENARRPVGKNGEKMIEKMNVEHGPLTAWGLEHFKFHGRVLDLGCGGGQALKLLSEQYPAPKSVFTGIDYAPLCVHDASALNREAIAGGSMKILEGDATALPFPAQSFDVVYSIESYYFWTQPEDGFREALRVLTSGGTFAVVAEMVGGQLSEEYELIRQRLRMTIYSEAEMRSGFESAGFAEVRSWKNERQGWLCVAGTRP